MRERGYAGGYTAVKRAVRDLRPDLPRPFEVRFETPPGEQAQVDFARFVVTFTDEPGLTRIVWLFSLVLGHSRLIWARFVAHQDLQTVLRCHIAALEAIGGAPREILYDRMKTAVTGEDPDGLVIYNRALLDLARHYGFQPRACRPYRAKTKGKVERPFRYIREDFFLGGSFRHLDDLNGQLRHWLDTVANPRVHATTQRAVNEAFAEEKPFLRPLPMTPYRAVLKLERRLSHEGLISVGGNLYSVPETTRRRARRPCLGRRDPDLRRWHAHRHPCPARGPQAVPDRSGPPQGRAAIPPPNRHRGDRLPSRRRGRRPPFARLLRRHRSSPGRSGRRPMSLHAEIVPSVVDRIKRTLVSLKMPRALEIVDATVRRIERGEVTPLEAIDMLLVEELTLRENRRVRMALQMAKLSAVKTLAGFDFSFQPSLDRNRILALAELQFIDRSEVVHLLGPPGTGKSHLSLALGVEAVKAGRSVYFTTLADSSARSPGPSGTAACARRSRHGKRVAIRHCLTDQISTFRPSSPRPRCGTTVTASGNAAVGHIIQWASAVFVFNQQAMNELDTYTLRARTRGWDLRLNGERFSLFDTFVEAERRLERRRSITPSRQGCRSLRADGQRHHQSPAAGPSAAPAAGPSARL